MDSHLFWTLKHMELKGDRLILDGKGKYIDYNFIA